MYSIDKNVAVGKTNKVWYAAHNDKGKLDEGGANYAVMVKDSAPKSSEVDKLYALIRSYPGVTRGGMHSRSFVEISQTVSGGVGIQVRYNLNFANDPITLRPYAGLTGGMHVHTGRTCAIASEVGSHYFKDGAKDPWANVRWTLFDGTNSVQVADLSPPALPSLSDMEGHAFVVHATTDDLPHVAFYDLLYTESRPLSPLKRDKSHNHYCRCIDILHGRLHT